MNETITIVWQIKDALSLSAIPSCFSWCRVLWLVSSRAAHSTLLTFHPRVQSLMPQLQSRSQSNTYSTYSESNNKSQISIKEEEEFAIWNMALDLDWTRTGLNELE